MKRISLSLSAQQLTAIKALAQRSGLKISELIRRAIDAYLKREK